MGRTTFEPFVLRTIVSIPGCGAGTILATRATRTEHVTEHRDRVRRAIRRALDPASVPAVRTLPARTTRTAWVRGLERQAADRRAVARSLGPRRSWRAAVHFDRDGAIPPADAMTRVAEPDPVATLLADADALATEAATYRPWAVRSGTRAPKFHSARTAPAKDDERDAEADRIAQVRAEADALRMEARKAYRLNGNADRRADTWTDVARRPAKPSGLF